MTASAAASLPVKARDRALANIMPRGGASPHEQSSHAEPAVTGETPARAMP